jgi:hypothetical protein
LLGGRVYFDIHRRHLPALSVTQRRQLDFFETVRGRVGVMVTPHIRIECFGVERYHDSF